MGTYIVQRLVLFVPTLILVSLVAFFVMRILPGDPAVIVLMGATGEGSFTPEELKAVQKQLGTDRPLHIQYGKWLWGVVQGDFGKSFFYAVPVSQEMKTRFPITLELTIMAIIISFLVAVPLGVLSAVKQDSWADHATKVFTLTGIAMPNFLVGILVIYILARWFDWLPPLGYANLWDDPLTNLQQLLLPALALGYANCAFTARVTRSSMLEVMREDYIRTARAKGLNESFVIFRHALKNAFLPVITVSGFQFARLLGGSVLIEQIFLVPGVGSLLVDSIFHRDFNIIQATIILVATLILVLNLMIDLLYGWINPRVRYA